MNKAEIQRLVAAQRAAFAEGRTLDIASRRSSLERLKASLLKHEAAMFEAVRKDMGRAEVETYFMEINMNLEELDFALKHLDGWASPRSVKTPTLFFAADSELHPEPYGVTLIIAAWNFPFLQLFSPLIGALAAGNTAVLKPAGDSPHCAAVAAQIVREAFTPDIVTVVEGSSELTTMLLEEKLDYIFFTGSPRVGRIIQSAAAKHLTPVTLELGGKSPAIIDESADIDQAAKRVMWSKLFNAGQICVTVDHAYVHESVHEAFIESCKKWVAEFYGADPSQSPDYGFIINTRNFERAVSYLDVGARLRHGGRFDAERRYIEPTIFDQVDESSLLMKDELFAPILPVLSFRSLDELLALQRSKDKPLALYFFSKDSDRQRQVIRGTSSGGVTINDCMSHGGTLFLPFGGVGNSGMGSYHGAKSFETFSHMKAVMTAPTARILDLPLKYPPYAGKLATVKRLERFHIL